MSSQEDAPSASEAPVPGLPGPLPISGIWSGAGRLVVRKPLQLIGIFFPLYAAAIGLLYLGGQLEGAALIVAEMGIRTLVGVLGAFGSALAAILLADTVAGRETPQGAALGTLRVHAKDLIAAGLLSTVIAYPLDFFLPLTSLILLGPPLVAPVIALEYRQFNDALGRVRELMQGQSGRIASLVLMFVLSGWLLFWGIGGFLILPFIGPLFTAGMFVVYLDTRARAEELDFEAFREERELAMAEGPAPDSNLG